MGNIEAIVAIIGVLFAAAALTWLLDRTVGRYIARRSRTAAFVTCALGLPLLLLAAGYVSFVMEQAEHPTSDWPAMGFLSTIIFSAWSLLATIPVAWFSTFGPARVPNSHNGR